MTILKVASFSPFLSGGNGFMQLLIPVFPDRMSRATLRFFSIGLMWLGLSVQTPSSRFVGSIIQVEDTEIGAGQSGVVNVGISSSDGSDFLSLYDVVFSLSPIVSQGGTLEFIEQQKTLENTDFDGTLNLDFTNVTTGNIIIALSSAAVPEPGSLNLFAAGGAGWLVRSRRKRSALAAAPIAL